jgi:hypothetical protein
MVAYDAHDRHLFARKMNFAATWISYPFHQSRCRHDALSPVDLTDQQFIRYGGNKGGTFWCGYFSRPTVSCGRFSRLKVSTNGGFAYDT